MSTGVKAVLEQLARSSAAFFFNFFIQNREVINLCTLFIVLHWVKLFLQWLKVAQLILSHLKPAV